MKPQIIKLDTQTEKFIQQSFDELKVKSDLIIAHRLACKNADHVCRYRKMDWQKTAHRQIAQKAV